MTLPPPRVVLRAMRPRQWIKNVLVVAAPIAAGTLDEASVAWRTLLAFVVFTAAASAIYLLNDVADVETDRLHPSKSQRPIAA
ncbi:MAG: decaprenyl-phosphate phosphoribosyltransferase, partial [Acidimicrobiales bacterium]